MRILAVDTSAAQATAACLEDGAVVSEAAADSARRHAETVLPMIDSALQKAGWELGDADAFAVDIGPGSFTGVRIGVSVVNAFAYALGKPVLGISSLRALAEKHSGREEPVLSVLDAGNGNAYAAVYRKGQEEQDPSARTMEEAMGLVPEPRILCGDAEGMNEMPDASDVGRAAFRIPDSRGDSAVPAYLRPSQAERLFARRNGKPGGPDGQ